MTDVFKEALGTPQIHRWQHQGVECAVHQAFTLNGYCLLPEGHPLADKWVEEIGDFDVHGGITFQRGRVIGFDTGHYGDSWPGSSFPGHIWRLDEVIAETNRLAEQIAEGAA